ncbi:MAG: pantoate--beta-alanine ligase [Alphaproteobacteria bacterium]|nr:pantoate--beta-alanine ligase [Alphaproteobacteria bacterium]
MTVKIVRNVASLRREISQWKIQGLTIAVVPTMGALHEGHLDLVREGFKHADRVVVTIFVNPKQFGVNEDLSRYPRDEEGDIEKLAAENVPMIYAPTPDSIYPPGFSSSVHMEGPAMAGLEDKFRPHFFDGVATVVSKLFIQTGANYAMFGEKDYQQLQVVTRMAKDLDIPIEVVGCQTRREEDGLAMSSRNRYLSKTERQQATAIYKNLMQAAEKIRSGVNQQTATRAASRSLTTLGFKVDYVTARNAETLAVPQDEGEPLRLIAAAWLGKTRLIDNIGV